MSEHLATVVWERRGAAFVDNRYSRVHAWEFDGGAVVPAAASPANVRGPYTDPSAVDPEEAYVAALASCHMLWFLHIAAKRGYRIDSYRDQAVATMGRDGDGRIAVTRVTLRPHILIAGEKEATAEIVQSMHDEAHHECFLANSVKTELVTIPTFEIIVSS